MLDSWRQAMLRTRVQSLKWPVQASVFVTHFLHHTLAFFVWASLILHVAIPMIGAGLNVHQISQEARNFLNEGSVSWRGVIAVALVPAVLVALRQAYLSWEGLHDRLQQRGYAPNHSVHLLKWPIRSGRFIATLLHQAAGFCGWIWILFALVGSLGEAGSYATRLREAGFEYFKDVGGIDWRYLLAISAVPALLVSLWNAKRAYRRLHAMAQDHLPKLAAHARPAA
jgi:hypothetical protein